MLSRFRLLHTVRNRLSLSIAGVLSLFVALAGLVLVAACDRGAPTNSGVVEAQPETVESQQTAEQQIRQRAEDRWAALSQRDFAAAYEYETPGYRSTVSIAQFQSQFGAAVRWIGASVESVTFAETGDRAEVKVQLDYEAPDALGGLYTNRRAMFERWIASEGNWWYVRE